jgi:uncharacterized protein YndB with AHSA1/START domain
MAARAEVYEQTGADRPVVITRVVEAPRIAVFRAWTVPQRLLQWWAPRGFTTPFCTVELRPGGAFHFCMRSPEGMDVWGLGIYREIVAPERIVYTDSFADADGNRVEPARYGVSPDFPSETLVTVTFAEHTQATTVTVQHSGLGETSERDAIRQGWTEMLDRLAGLLASS